MHGLMAAYPLLLLLMLLVFVGTHLQERYSPPSGKAPAAERPPSPGAEGRKH